MKKYIVLLLSFLCLVEAISQISINDCSLYQGAPTVTQQMIDDADYEFNKPCMILDNTFNFNGSINKAITSINSIDILPGFESGNYDPNYGMDIKIQPKADFDVAVMNYSDLNNVLKLKKFELGVQLPPSILEKVNNFVADANIGEKINPYLEDEIRVVAEFTHFWSSQLGYLSNVNLPIDGYYAKEFISEMNTTPLIPDNELYFDDEEYWDLGRWNEVPTEYPFRIRFAPPLLGEWSCIVKIIVGTDVYESNVFSFNVIDSGSEGYMKAGTNGRFLALGDKTFIPIGCNISWPETREEFDPELSQYMKSETLSGRAENYRKFYVIPRVYEKYKNVMNNLIDNGANYFRTIMYPTGTEIEWEKIGNYTKRLHIAQEMDKILELAEQRDAYIHWNLQIHYSFQNAAAAYGCAWTWDYEAPGGVKFCYRKLLENDNIPGNEAPVNFFSHEESKKYYKQRLRYIIARYGYSTNVSAFELFSEISNVGSILADNSDFYKTGNNYIVYENWHREMAEYIKSHYNGKIHLVTASYAGEKVVEDLTFRSPDIGLSTSNIYNTSAPKFSDGFWNNQVAEKYLNDDCSDDDIVYEGYNDPCGDEANFSPKPMIFSETGPLDIECSGNYIETNRNMWEGLFSGLAGALSWNNWYNPDNYAIYGQMKNFVAGIDFDGGQWHPGASKRNDLPRWIYKGEFAEDMEIDDVVDLAYLRSGDGNYAIGVITNLTFNSRNFPSFATSCVNPEKWPIPADTMIFPNAKSTVNADFFEGLKLRDLRLDNYYIDYFLPTDISIPIHSSNGNYGGQIPLEINIVPTEQTYIILFKARRQGHSWDDILQVSQTNINNEEKESADLNIDNFSSSILASSSSEKSKTHREITIEAYPVPTKDNLMINVQNYNGIINYIIESMDGKIIKYSQINNEEKIIEFGTIEKGTYLLKFMINGQTFKTQKIIRI